ncbi:acetylajmalan esterase-like [Actinidia eriantha]|uniref:acetylajmalan esterase-like n=1 Tax=Actinidia eriantha TaxID=165200 RepID=UPI0025845921|nr:acetylajmalan esterase-like [Actinidia eriantha]
MPILSRFVTLTAFISFGDSISDTASAAGLPFLNPYKNNEANFRHGANFAVAGSTALPVEVLAGKNISTMVTGSSLSVQLDWMFTHFNAICNTDRDCVEKLKNSLFMVGEIGGNDYNYALFQGKTIEEVQSMVPDVVQAIKEAVKSKFFLQTTILINIRSKLKCFLLITTILI